jgi:hypothetical protein
MFVINNIVSNNFHSVVVCVEFLDTHMMSLGFFGKLGVTWAIRRGHVPRVLVLVLRSYMRPLLPRAGKGRPTQGRDHRHIRDGATSCFPSTGK